MMNADLEYAFTWNRKILVSSLKINTKTLYSKLELYVDFCIFKITRLCSSSSYKIFNGKNIIFQIGILCWSKEDVNRYVSTWNFKIMFKFKLQDYQWEEHYIPNWNFLPKTKKRWKVVFDQNCLMFRIIEGNCLIEWKLLIEFCIHCLIMIYCTRIENDWA